MSVGDFIHYVICSFNYSLLDSIETIGILVNLGNFQLVYLSLSLSVLNSKYTYPYSDLSVLELLLLTILWIKAIAKVLGLQLPEVKLSFIGVV